MSNVGLDQSPAEMFDTSPSISFSFFFLDDFMITSMGNMQSCYVESQAQKTKTSLPYETSPKVRLMSFPMLQVDCLGIFLGNGL